MLQITTPETFYTEISKDKIVVVDFCAKWCRPCKEIESGLNDLNVEFGEKVELVKVDVDDDEVANVCTEYRVKCVPTFIFFKDGKRVHRIIGAALNDVRAEITNQL